jgi:hypothetical protein
MDISASLSGDPGENQGNPGDSCCIEVLSLGIIPKMNFSPGCRICNKFGYLFIIFSSGSIYFEKTHIILI